MKSEIIRDEIIFIIKDYKTIIKEFNNYKFDVEMNDREAIPNFDDEHELEVKILFKQISDLLFELYENCLTDNFYFFDCPLKVYKNNYNKRLQNFQSSNIDADEIDFLKKEIESLYHASSHRELANIVNTVNYNDFIFNELKFKISLNKKKEYIANKLQEKGWCYEQLPDESVMVDYDQFEMQPGGYEFVKKSEQNQIEEYDSNKDNNFTFDKNKSLEHNLSKLTIFPIVTYDSGKLKKIAVNTHLNQEFITNISELKSVLIEVIFNQIKELEKGYKLIFAKKLRDNLKFKIEALHNQINLVKENLTKSDDYVIDVLTLSLSLNKEVNLTLEEIISIEGEGSAEIQEKENKTNNVAILDSSTIKKTKNNYDSIFLSEESQNLFDTILEQMGIEESNIKKRGNQAKLHALWEVSVCKNRLFKTFKTLSDYTNFLNKKFGTSYESRNFSDGSSHHNRLKILLNDIK